MDGLLLLLLDSRAPSGAHAHSGGMEPAVTAGLVQDLGDVSAFCRARLRTSGQVSAAFAAAACQLALGPAAAGGTACLAATRPSWEELDGELDARMPSEALRSASRSLGGGLRRMVASMFPDVPLPWPAAPAPHHPVVLGVAVALAGGDPALAAQAAALASVTGPASAAVRLLGLDPLAVQGMLARLVGDCSADAAVWAMRPLRSLPAGAAPYLDLLADVHRTSEVRLFAS